jgi:hypothetical protein
MGAFYVNYTVRVTDQKSAVKALAGKKAFVSPEQNGSVVTCEQESDKQDEKTIAKLATELSRRLHCTVFAVLLHDSDILWYQLYLDGKLSDQYNSTPDYWSAKPEPSGPAGGDAKQLCAAFACTEVAAVERILRATWQTYPDAMSRHADLVQALGLPDFAVGFGYEGTIQGYLPAGLSAENIVASHS